MWLSCNESACNAGDLGSIAGLGRSPGEKKGYPLQYSGLEDSMDYESHTTEQLSLTFLSSLCGRWSPSSATYHPGSEIHISGKGLELELQIAVASLLI